MKYLGVGIAVLFIALTIFVLFVAKCKKTQVLVKSKQYFNIQTQSLIENQFMY